MESKATLSTVRIAPRKLRVVLDAVKKTSDVEIALAKLRFSNKRGARIIEKLIESAVANAENLFGNGDPAELVISKAFVNEGPTLKRFKPRAMGRATRINKRTSHITVVLSEKE